MLLRWHLRGGLGSLSGYLPKTSNHHLLPPGAAVNCGQILPVSSSNQSPSEEQKVTEISTGDDY